ncbi:MAG: DUF1156 domain-containing protein [Dehalococcoidales bacterium]|nr:DUF1156 domain-containing protein [Dehalococcoidales bacterium]
MAYRKKLIEIAIPLDVINLASAREKSIRRGHPSTMHLWWARRPLAACRAVIFCSIVDDPDQPNVPEELLRAIDSLPSPITGSANAGGSIRRAKLFNLIEELVKWENINNEVLLGKVHSIIRAATENNPPPVIDPFCGGGSIPIEAQRLGLLTYPSDLNPVAVLITKAMVEIPPKFRGKEPINPDIKRGIGGTASWKGVSGLANDVLYYGKWLRDRAWERIGQLYPKGPNGDTIIAWLWARTVKCPNPVCGAHLPLVHSFELCSGKGREVWINPIVDENTKTIKYTIRTGNGNPPTGTVNRLGAKCIVCGTAVPFSHIRSEGRAGRIGQQLMSFVTESNGKKTYHPGTQDQANIAERAKPEWEPDTQLPDQALGLRVQLYGLTSHASLFTKRQLAALSTFSSLIEETRTIIAKTYPEQQEYANAIATYLALVLGRYADYGSALTYWDDRSPSIQKTFGLPTMQMRWAIPEINPFGTWSGNWLDLLDGVISNLEHLPAGNIQAKVRQLDAVTGLPDGVRGMFCTDPPYYDNIGYAVLSDFFYIWLRHTLNGVYPDLFSTVLTPKEQELIAEPARHKNKDLASSFFENNLREFFTHAGTKSLPDFPMSVFYAFKQQEISEAGEYWSTGWEVFLKGLLDSGFCITGTWPLRTEQTGGLRLIDRNALASSIVVVCRPRSENAPIATRREFLSALRQELPKELNILMSGSVAPVDLAQATIGPGIAIFSRYSKVLEADGSAMTVHTALQEINYFIEDYMAQQEGDLDTESQFCVAWFQQHGNRNGLFGEADVLARAKNISVEGLARLGLIEASQGSVRLKLREDYGGEWDPAEQPRLTAWEACQRLVWTLNALGETEAGILARRLGGMAEQAKELAYRLFTIAEHKGWAEEAGGYNALVSSWLEIQKVAAASSQETQGRMT